MVRALVLLLRGYARNSARTNHCAARLLHRLARDLHMEPLLFQLSLFALFHRLLSDPAAAAHQVRQGPECHPGRGLWLQPPVLLCPCSPQPCPVCADPSPTESPAAPRSPSVPNISQPCSVLAAPSPALPVQTPALLCTQHLLALLCPCSPQPH